MNQAEIRRKQIQLFSAVLGLLTIWILGKYVGDNGITYLAGAIEVYLLFWTLVCSQVPETVTRILRARIAKGQYKNADKMCYSVLSFQIAVGILGGLILIISASFITDKVLSLSYSKYLMFLLAPVFFLRTVTGVLTGIFQGKGSEMPTACSSILRQILILLLGILFCKKLTEYGEKVSNLLQQDAYLAMYGVIGIVCAAVLAELIVLLFLIILYRTSVADRKGNAAEGSKTTDSYFAQIYSLYSGRGVAVLGSIFLLLPLWTGFLFYRKTVNSVQLFSEKYGVFFGKYMVITGIIIIAVSALLLPCAAIASGLMKKDENRSARNTFQCGVKTIMVYGAYFAVFTGVSAVYTADAFSLTQKQVTQKILEAGSVWILSGMLLVYGIVIFTLLGKRYLTLVCLAAGDIVYIIVMTVSLRVGKADILALVYALIAGSIVTAAVLMILLYRYFRCSIDLLRTIAIPFGASCVSGLIAYLLGKILAPHLGSQITVWVLFLISFTIYWSILILFRCFLKTDYETMPGGKILKILGRIV